MTQTFASPEEALAHFGVKGMKWGVRKEDPHRSTESFRDRRKASKSVNSHLWELMKDEPMFAQAMTRAEYDSLSTKGASFVAGTSLKRIVSSPEASLKGALYVSKLEADANFYRAVLPAYGPNIKGLGGGGKKIYKHSSHEMDLETVKKLNLPSDKQRVDAFLEILSKPAIRIPGKDAPITGRQFLEDTGYKRMFKNKSDQEAMFIAYHDFVMGQGIQNNPLNEAYFNNLRSKGFNAVVDANDGKRLTKNPLILLDAQNTVTIKQVRRLSADEINRAQRQLTGR